MVPDLTGLLRQRSLCPPNARFFEPPHLAAERCNEILVYYIPRRKADSRCASQQK
jgi:hypothetical protein